MILFMKGFRPKCIYNKLCDMIIISIGTLILQDISGVSREILNLVIPKNTYTNTSTHMSDFGAAITLDLVYFTYIVYPLLPLLDTVTQVSVCIPYEPSACYFHLVLTNKHIIWSYSTKGTLTIFSSISPS